MIKRSPQEIADFYQGYVFNSCSALSWVVTPDKPKIVNGEWTWDHDSILWFTLPVYALNVPADHHWTHLYEPSAKESKIGSNYQKEADSDNKPDHLGEVYTHKEYSVIFQPTIATLTTQVNKKMDKGWRPQGGIIFVRDGDYGLYHQAMVRGV